MKAFIILKAKIWGALQKRQGGVGSGLKRERKEEEEEEEEGEEKEEEEE